MSQTLIIEGNEQRGSLLSLNLQVYTGTNVIWKSSIEEAIKVIKVLPQINLIMAMDEQAGELDQLISMVDSMKLSIPILSNQEHKSAETICKLNDDFDLTEIIKVASDNLGIVKSDVIKKVLPDFYPVPIESFKLLKKAPCDIFIKLKKGNGSFRFVKRIASGDFIDHDGINRYIIKGVESLNIVKEDRFKFTDSFSSSVMEDLYNESLTTEQAISVTKSASDVIRLFFGEDQFNQSDVDLIDGTIEAVEKLCSRDQKMTDLIQSLLDSTNSYRYKLMILTSYLGIKAMRQMKNLGPVTVLASQIEKFNQAAFLHDILLKSDDQARVRCEDDIEKYNIIEKELVQTHALSTSNMVKSIPSIPDEVVRVILEHHGKPTGSGFSNDFSNRLHPLTHVLMACEAYAHELLKYEGQVIDYDKVIKELPPIFLKKEFWKVLSSLG